MRKPSKLTNMLLNNNFPIDVKTTLIISKALNNEYLIFSNMSLMGYNSRRAANFKAVLLLINSTAIEIWEALNCLDLTGRLWGGICYEKSSDETKKWVGRFLSYRDGINDHCKEEWKSALEEFLEENKL